VIPLQTAASHPVSHIVFAPDGSTVAVAQPHYGVTLLERATGQTLAVCAMPRRATLTGLTFCDDGKYLAASHAKGLEVFETAMGARVRADFRDDFKYMSLAERGGVVFGLGSHTAGAVWRPEKPNDTECHYDPLSNGCNHLMPLSPDGRFALERVCRDRIKLHDLDAVRYAAEIERPSADAAPTFAARFCPLSRRFAINNGHTLDVYDSGTPAEEDEDEQQAETPLVQREDGTQTTVAPKPHAVLAPTFSLKPDKASEAGDWYPPFALLADGRGLLVKRPRNRIQLWDAPTGTLINEWSWRFEWVTCIAVSADGTTAVAGGRFGRLLLWDLE
jgi:WD40 repeat protein